MFTLNFLFEAKSLICRENKNCTLYTTLWFGEARSVKLIFCLKFPLVGSLFVKAYCYRLGLELCIFQAEKYHHLWGFQNIKSTPQSYVYPDKKHLAKTLFIITTTSATTVTTSQTKA